MADAVAVGNAAIARRMVWCRDVLGIREKLATVPAAKEINARALARNRIGALRRLLLGRAPSLLDELLSPETGFKKLAEVLEAAKSQSEDEQRAARAYGEEIYRLLRAIGGQEQNNGLADTLRGGSEVFSLFGELPDIVTAKQTDPLVDANIERGKFDEAFRAEIARAATIPESHTLRLEEVAPELEKERAEIESEIAAARDVYSQASVNYRGAAGRLKDAIDRDASSEELDRIQAEVDSAAEAETKAYKEYTGFKSAKYDEYQAKVKAAMDKAREELEAPIKAVGQKAIAAVVNASPISEDAAKAWADAVEITTTAANRLKKSGYPVDKVRADIAEFYRFVGGRVGTVRIDSKGDRRANATQIYSAGSAGTVWIDGRFGKRVLWHELGHHIEADPVARAAAGRFIRRRSVNGEAVVKLRALTGNPGYRSDEVAYQNGFFSPYVGKYYKDGVTEVFSMGIESFSDPLTLGRRMAQDPQTLEFVSGYLKAEQSPLYKAFMQLRESMREMNSDATADAKDELAGLLEKLASGVVFIADTDRSWMSGVRPYGADEWKQLGRFSDDLYLFSGKVRNEKKRKVNGLIVVRNTGPGGWPDYSDIPSTDMVIAKALAAIWISRPTRMPYWWQMNDLNYLTEAVKQ